MLLINVDIIILFLEINVGLAVAHIKIKSINTYTYTITAMDVFGTRYYYFAIRDLGFLDNSRNVFKNFLTIYIKICIDNNNKSLLNCLCFESND